VFKEDLKATGQNHRSITAPKQFYHCSQHQDPHLPFLSCCPIREPILASAARAVLPRACTGSSTEDGTGFTDGASYFEKPVFKKGTQSSAIENTVTNI
jgi:hypothetical protein